MHKLLYNLHRNNSRVLPTIARWELAAPLYTQQIADLSCACITVYSAVHTIAIFYYNTHFSRESKSKPLYVEKTRQYAYCGLNTTAGARLSLAGV